MSRAAIEGSVASSRPVRDRSEFSVLLWFCLVFGVGEALPNASAEVKGDPGLLKTAAAKYRANLDRLQTWRGRVEYRSQIDRPDGTRLVLCNIDFAWDKRASAYRFDIRTTKDVRIVGGKETPAMELNRRVGLFRDGTYHELHYPLAKENARHVAIVRPEKTMKPGFHYGSFEPGYFLGQDGHEMDKQWLFLCEHANDKEIALSLTRDGDRLILTQGMAESGLKTTSEINLARGATLEKIRTSETVDKIEKTWTWTWKWQEVNGVWVPSEVRKDHTRAGLQPEEYHYAIQWTESVVNETLGKDEFSLVKLGVRRDDTIADTRSGKRYSVEGKEYPPGPNAAEVPVRRTLFNMFVVLGSVAVLLVLVAALHLRSRRKGARQ